MAGRLMGSGLAHYSVREGPMPNLVAQASFNLANGRQTSMPCGPLKYKSWRGAT